MPDLEAAARSLCREMGWEETEQAVEAAKEEIVLNFEKNLLMLKRFAAR